MVDELKQENKCLSSKVKVETATKEKYFEMWRMSEKEKDKLTNSRLAILGNVKNTCAQVKSIK